MGGASAGIFEEIRQRGTIRDSDVARLAAAFSSADSISAEDADQLFSLHVTCPIQDPGWSPFFIDAIAEYVVHHAPPAGYVVAANARWLMERIASFGRVETTTELALLVHVLEAARWTPPSLPAFALDQIRYAIETGTGPLRAGREPETGIILPEEVELAARILRASGRETSLAVTRIEADSLFAINRALAAGRTSPSWSALFTGAVGWAVLSATGHAVPSRAALVATPTGLEATPELMAVLMGEPDSAASSRRRERSAGQGGGARVWSTAPIRTAEERALARLERQRLEIITSEVIEEASEDWLMHRLSEAGSDPVNEAALLAFIQREASKLPPALAEFAARKSIAA